MAHQLNLHSAVESIVTDPGNGVVMARSSSVPADATAGYSHGCLYVKTNGTTESDAVYVNVGSNSSCNFDAITDITESGFLSGVTAGTAAASKALVLDSSSNIATINSATIGTVVTGAVNASAAATTITVKANTAAALRVYDSTTAIWSVDTRNTLKNVSAVTITGQPVTVASETAAHINASLNLAAKTITYTGGTGTTSSFGTMLYVGVPTLTDSTAMTLDAASAVHINAVAAAGGSLTITASYMISTSVSDCFLTNAGVWTDHSSGRAGKQAIADVGTDQVAAVLDRVRPRSWKYRQDVHGDDGNRTRIGIVADELPDELGVPGPYGKRGVASGVLASFSLAALKNLHDRVSALERN